MDAHTVDPTAPVDQTQPLIPLTATPGPNDPAFQPSPANVVGDLNVPPAVPNDQDAKASGDLISGGFCDQADGGNRWPQVKGL